MIFKVVDSGIAKAHIDLDYLLVHFWFSKDDYEAGKPADHINDFMIQRMVKMRVFVTDSLGRRKRRSGKFDFPYEPDANGRRVDQTSKDDPWFEELIDPDLVAEHMKSIRIYGERILKTTPNRRDATDPEINWRANRQLHLGKIIGMVGEVHAATSG